MPDSLFKQYEGVFEEKEALQKEKAPFEFAYSPFALQDAVGEKSAKKAWIEYEKLRFDGIEADELIYKIVAKVRDMLAIKRGASKEDLGIQKDYPFLKSKKDSLNWKEKDLEYFYASLVSIFHDSRKGILEIDSALEKILLKV